MKRIFIIAAIATFFLGSCSKSDERTVLSKEMHFTVAHPAITRALASTFETDDVMGVYVTQYNVEIPTPLQPSGNYANNAVVKFDGSKWTASPVIYWDEGKFDVYAYYPYAKPFSVDEYPFVVALDQSTAKTVNGLGGYEASDFLWAKAEGVSQITSVPITFTHRMSKVVVNLIKGDNYTGNIPDDAIVRIHNTVPAATIDLASGTVTKNGYESAQSITAMKSSTGSYTAIIVPQRIDTRLPLIEVLSKNVSYMIESSFVFRAGTKHTINVILNNNPDQVKIDIGGEIVGGW